MAKLLDPMRDAIRTRHPSIRTEDAYPLWARQFLLFHGKTHPAETGEREVWPSPSQCTVERKVAAEGRVDRLSRSRSDNGPGAGGTFHGEGPPDQRSRLRRRDDTWTADGCSFLPAKRGR